MRRFFRPRKTEPRIHAVVIALKSSSKLVRLKAASNTHEQVVQHDRRPALPFDNEVFAVPGFEPEFVVLPVGITLHIQKKARKFISDEREALRPCLQKDGKPLNRAVRQGQPRGNEGAWLGCVRWLWRHWQFGVDGLGYGGLPFFLFRLGFLSAGFVLTLHLRDLLFASAFDQRQDAPGNVHAGRLAGTGKADDCHPHGQRLGPGAACAHATRCPNEARSNAEQWYCDVCRCYARATGRPKKPSVQRGGQCFNRKIWQLTPPVVEQRPIWLFPGASFGLPAPRLLLVAGSLLRTSYGGKVRKVGKCRAVIARRGFAVRQVQMRLPLASLDPSLDGSH